MPDTVLSRHTKAAEQHLPGVRIIIGDEERTAGSSGTFPHVNPTTGQVQAHVPLAGSSEVDEAVLAARKALPDWRRMKPADRRDLLLRFAGLLREMDGSELSAIENGVAVCNGRSAMVAYDYTSYYASLADKVEGLVTAANEHDGFIYTLPEPCGVVAVITTWNGPLVQLAMKAAPALAAGNTLVIKPPEITPF